MGFDLPYNQPYFTGAPVSVLVPTNFPVAIAGHPYMTDVRKISTHTLPSLAPQSDTQKDITEAAFSREGYQRRGQSRFGLGAGQQFFDDVETANGRRFWTSKGLDPWQDRGLTLLHDTQLKTGAGAPTGSTNLKVLSVGGYLYVADSSNLKLTADPSPASPAWTSIAAGGTISGLCTDGVYVYVAIAGAVVQRTVIGAASMAVWTGSATPTSVWFANGRLIGATANLLFEIDANGVMVGSGIRTDPRGTSAVWTTVTSSPHAIFAALDVGGNCEVYSLGVDDATSAISVPIWACGLPAGETMNAMTFYAGVVIFATSIGIRIAQLVSTFSATTNAKTLEFGEAIGNAPGQPALFPGGVLCLEAQANFLWFGWTNYDTVSTGLGRANLATNISADTVVPAYASDLMATVQGSVLGVASLGGRRYFAVSGSGLYGETLTYVPSGTFNSGWIRFNSLYDKQFAGVQLGTDRLVGSIAASMLFVDGTTRDVGTFANLGDTVSPMFDATGKSVAAELALTFTRGSTTTAPVLRYWAVNSYPAPPRVNEYILSVFLSTNITDLVNQEHAFDPLDEWNYLTGLMALNTPIICQIGVQSFSARVDDVAIQEGDINSWQDPRGRGGQTMDHFWFNGVKASVRILTRETD